MNSSVGLLCTIYISSAGAKKKTAAPGSAETRNRKSAGAKHTRAAATWLLARTIIPFAHTHPQTAPPLAPNEMLCIDPAEVIPGGWQPSDSLTTRSTRPGLQLVRFQALLQTTTPKGGRVLFGFRDAGCYATFQRSTYVQSSTALAAV